MSSESACLLRTAMPGRPESTPCPRSVAPQRSLPSAGDQDAPPRTALPVHLRETHLREARLGAPVFELSAMHSVQLTVNMGTDASVQTDVDMQRYLCVSHEHGLRQ